MSDDAAAVDLAEAVRRLMQATVLTTLDDQQRREIAAEIDTLTTRLVESSRETMPWRGA